MPKFAKPKKLHFSTISYSIMAWCSTQKVSVNMFDDAGKMYQLEMNFDDARIIAKHLTSEVDRVEKALEDIARQYPEVRA